MIPIWVPLILAAASLGANYAGQKKTDKAREAALNEARLMREEKAREAELAAKKTGDLFTQTADNEKTAAAAQEARYTDATQGQQAQATMADILSRVQPSGATSYVQEAKDIADKSNARIAQRAKTMAALGSFGDVMVGNEIASARNRADIGQAGSSLQNWSQNVLPLQLEAANAAGRNWHSLADVLQAASAITSMGALSTPAAAGTTATTGAASSAAPAANWASKGYGAFFRSTPYT